MVTTQATRRRISSSATITQQRLWQKQSVGAAAAGEVEENPVGHCGCSATTTDSLVLLPIYRRRKGKREETGETGNAWQTGGKVLLLRVSLTFAQVLLLTELRRRRAVSRPLFSSGSTAAASMSIRGRADGNSSGSG